MKEWINTLRCQPLPLELSSSKTSSDWFIWKYSGGIPEDETLEVGEEGSATSGTGCGTDSVI